MAGRNVIRFENVNGRAIMYRNFTGKAGTYNNEGERSFCLSVDEETAAELRADGFNVRERSRTNDDGETTTLLYLPIKVNMNSRRPPQINQVTKNGVTTLDEDTISNLDWAEIINASISISAYNWTYGNKSGVSAYLQELLVEIEDESFLSKYMSEHND